MPTPLETMLEETFQELDSLSPDKIHTLINEALKTFLDLKEKSQSTDAKEREEAFKAALSLKQAIQTQTEEISKSIGLDPALFSSMGDNPDLFTAETWVELSSAKKELEEFNKQLGVERKKQPPSSKKSKTTWIPS